MSIEIQNQYPWAVNVSKLLRAVASVNAAHLVDPKIEVDTESVKAEYLKIGGLIRDEAEKEEGDVTPKKKGAKKAKAVEETEESDEDTE